MKHIFFSTSVLLLAALSGEISLAANTAKSAALSATPSLVSARVVGMDGKALKQVTINQPFKVEYTVKNLDQSKVENMFSDFQILTARTGDKPVTTLDEACRESKPIAADMKMYPQSEVRTNYSEAVSDKVEISSAGKDLTKLTMKFNPLTTAPCRMYGELANKIVIPGMTMWVEVDAGFEDMTLKLKSPIELALISSDTVQTK